MRILAQSLPLWLLLIMVAGALTLVIESGKGKIFLFVAVPPILLFVLMTVVENYQENREKKREEAKDYQECLKQLAVCKTEMKENKHFAYNIITKERLLRYINQYEKSRNIKDRKGS